MNLLLIRHSITQGNLEKRYIGATDQPLCPQGILLAEKQCYCLEEGGIVLASPMLRCRQTAALLFPKAKVHVVEGFRECDFGQFENKNYEQLKETPAYTAWLKSSGKMLFPEGEGMDSFVERVSQAFCTTVEWLKEHKAQQAALVVHGGTIMAILSCYAQPKEPFYHWQVANCGGYLIEVDHSWPEKKVVSVQKQFHSEER